MLFFVIIRVFLLTDYLHMETATVMYCGYDDQLKLC